MVGMHAHEKAENRFKQETTDIKMAATLGLRCSFCGTMIKQGERYSKGFITGKLACYRCDDGLLRRGDNLVALDG
jgi:hypothetical protein